MVIICTAWDFLQEIHALGTRAMASFPLPLTTEEVSSICSISSNWLGILALAEVLYVYGYPLDYRVKSQLIWLKQEIE